VTLGKRYQGFTLLQPRLPSLGLILAAGGFLFGCRTSADLPRSARRLEFSVVSSGSVEVFQPQLRKDKGEFYLEGSVRRAFGAKSTAGSCLEYVCYSENNAVLSEKPGSFSPEKLPARSYHWYNDGYYRIPLTQVPLGTRRIEIRAITLRGEEMKSEGAR
jgi:hypothetical protein